VDDEPRALSKQCDSNAPPDAERFCLVRKFPDE
jgi:hypothetical protein